MPSLPLHLPTGYSIRWVVEESWNLVPILISTLGIIDYPRRRRRGVGGEIPLLSLLRHHTFRRRCL
jgi:hypothetical protein